MNALANPIAAWENDYWTPEPRFAGRTVFCLASGPSMNREMANRVRGLPAIAVNSTALLAPWADVLFFTDSGWYVPRRDFVEAWPGLAVSMSRRAKRELDDPAVRAGRPPRILRVKGCGAPPFPPRRPGGRPGFPPAGSPEIQQGRSSGHTAVSLAIAMGASRVALLGYDMRVVAGREHHHGEYTGPRDLAIYANEFVPGFAGWQAAAAASGVEILNCTPGSAVTEFPFADLDEVVACARS